MNKFRYSLRRQDIWLVWCSNPHLSGAGFASNWKLMNAQVYHFNGVTVVFMKVSQGSMKQILSFMICNTPFAWDMVIFYFRSTITAHQGRLSSKMSQDTEKLMAKGLQTLFKTQAFSTPHTLTSYDHWMNLRRVTWNLINLTKMWS